MELDARPSLSQTGTFAAHLLEATFSGVTASCDLLQLVLLPPTPSAQTSITLITSGPDIGKYDVAPPPFSNIHVRSVINGVIIDDGSMDMGPLRVVDEPATQALLISGLLAMRLRGRHGVKRN